MALQWTYIADGWYRVLQRFWDQILIESNFPRTSMYTGAAPFPTWLTEWTPEPDTVFNSTPWEDATTGVRTIGGDAFITPGILNLENEEEETLTVTGLLVEVPRLSDGVQVPILVFMFSEPIVVPPSSFITINLGLFIGPCVHD